MLSEEQKVKMRAYYHKNREKILKQQLEYQGGKKPELQKYYKAKYRMKKEHNRTYKKRLKYRKITPTNEEMDIMFRACKTFAFKHKLDEHEIWGAGYECLLKALYTYDPQKSPNKKGYITSKIHFGLVDIDREESGRKKEDKDGNKYYTKLTLGRGMVSYNEEHGDNKKYDDNTEFVYILAEEEYELKDDMIDLKHYLSIIKEELLSKPVKRNKNNKIKHSDFYDIFCLRHIKAMTMEKIGKRYNCNESNISLLFKRVINPAFERAKERIINL